MAKPKLGSGKRFSQLVKNPGALAAKIGCAKCGAKIGCAKCGAKIGCAKCGAKKMAKMAAKGAKRAK